MAGIPTNQLVANYGKLPLSFEANHGQVNDAVKFLARGHGYALFLTGGEAVLTLRKPLPTGQKPDETVKQTGLDTLEAFSESLRRDDVPFRHDSKAPESTRNQNSETTALATLRLQLAGSNSQATVAGFEELPGKSNYFIGNDPQKWRTNIPTYGKVKYEGIYSGIDLVYYGNQGGQLEYDFVVAPGAKPGAIALDVKGAKRMHIGPKGDLVLGAGQSELELKRPVLYQEVEGKRREVAGNFVLRGPHRIGFSLGPYDRSLPLVIDPTLVYSTYLGGSNITYAAVDTGKAIAVDSAGDVYVTGATSSVDFPVTTGAFEPTYPYTTAGFVSKLNPSGSALIYSTFFGNTSPGYTIVTGIAVDASGDAYLTGNTNYDFPTTPGAFQTSENLYGSYAFATELNPTGTGLVYSTFLGGADTTCCFTTYGFGIAVDASNNAYVVGTTTSPTYPTTPGAFQPEGCSSACGGTGFVTKVSAGGSSLAYSTYLGTGSNKPEAVAVDSSGDAYVVGSTEASTFPVTPGAFQTSSTDPEGTVFVTEFNPTGTALTYSTFLSGTNGTSANQAFAVAVDASGYAYVTGQTSDTNFPTTAGAYQTNLLDASDAFVTKLNLTGSALVYSTYLPGHTTGYGIGVNSSGEAYVTGNNYGSAGTFPTTSNAFQANAPTTTTNGFLTVFNSTGSGLVYSTYIGVTSGTYEIPVVFAVAVDSNGNAYITGSAQPGFPTTSGAFKTTLTANANYPYPVNAFIMKFGFPAAPLSISPTTIPAGTEGASYGPVQFTATGATGTVTFVLTAGSLPSGLTLSSAGALSGAPYGSPGRFRSR